MQEALGLLNPYWPIDADDEDAKNIKKSKKARAEETAPLTLSEVLTVGIQALGKKPRILPATDIWPTWLKA